MLCGHLHEVCRKEAGGGSETDLAGRDPAQLVLAAGGEEGALGSRTVGFCCVKWGPPLYRAPSADPRPLWAGFSVLVNFLKIFF